MLRHNSVELGLGKIPPQAVDMEVAVLGGLLLQSNLHSEIIPLMRPEHFYKEAHQRIFAHIESMFHKSETIDILTVTHKIKNAGELDLVGGAYYITTLTDKIASAANIEAHARVVTQKFLQRDMIRECSEIIRNCYEDTTDVFEVINRLQNFAAEQNAHIIGHEHEGNYEQEVLNVYKSIVSVSDKHLQGIPTGNANLDSITGGFNKTDLVILCGRPGMGKSSRMLEFAKHATLNGNKVAIFSLEMSRDQLIKKQLINSSGILSHNILRHTLSDSEKYDLSFAADKQSKLPFYLNERCGVNPNYIRTVCRERKKKYGLDLVIIDYLQLMVANETKGIPKEQQVASISIALKTMAKELEVPIIALAQLNRDLEKRSDKRPIKSDLRDSGQLEQDADLILSVYRPSQYYTYTSDPDYKDLDELTYKRVSEIGIMKNRHGESEVSIEERFIGEFSRFDGATKTTPF